MSLSVELWLFVARECILEEYEEVICNSKSPGS